MATEPAYTQDDNMIFLGRAVPQSPGVTYFPSGGSDTFSSEFVTFYQEAIPAYSIPEIIFGPFRSNSGYFAPDYMRRGSITTTVSTTPYVADGGRHYFRIGYSFNIVQAAGTNLDYYIIWGDRDMVSGGLLPFTLNTFGADDEDVQYGVIGATVTFQNGSVVLTSASTRGSPSGLGDYIGTYAIGTDPGYIVSITPP